MGFEIAADITKSSGVLDTIIIGVLQRRVARSPGEPSVDEQRRAARSPGDAVFVLHATPHSGTLNGWTEPRQNIYFRLVHKARTAAFAENTVTGRSDHMVRGWDGEFLAARPGLPHAALYESTVASLLDHWREWDGMRGIVAAAEGAPKL